MRFLKQLIIKLSIYFPNTFKIFIYKKFLKWEIGKNVKIGFKTYINCKNVVIKDNVRIGRNNLIDNLKYFELGQNCKIHSLNRIVGGNYEDWEDIFIAGESCGITNNHHIDCGGGVYLGDGVIIAGSSSQIWSHEVNLEKNVFRIKPVHINSKVYVGSSVLLSPGVNIPSNTTIGLGTVVPSKFKCEEGSLVVGNPASVKQKHKEVIAQ